MVVISDKPDVKVQSTFPLTDRGFTGHKHNDELGLIYMNARYYLPGIGRFLSADTLIPDPANPQSFNRYSYVLNNPLRYTDPSGHIACEELGTEECDENGDFVDNPNNLTYWIVEEMNFLPSIPEGVAIHNGFDPSSGMFPACVPCSYYIFYEMVKDGAPLDVKDKIRSGVGAKIQLGNVWFEYSTSGNILFGYYGAAWGFGSAELHVGAGFAQLADSFRDSSTPLGAYFFDTSDDYYAVEFGIYVYYEGYAPNGQLTVEEFTYLLTNYEHLNDMAVTLPPMSNSSNPNWPYSQGYFYNTQNIPRNSTMFPTFAQ